MRRNLKFPIFWDNTPCKYSEERNRKPLHNTQHLKYSNSYIPENWNLNWRGCVDLKSHKSSSLSHVSMPSLFGTSANTFISFLHYRLCSVCLHLEVLRKDAVTVKYWQWLHIVSCCLHLVVGQLSIWWHGTNWISDRYVNCLQKWGNRLTWILKGYLLMFPLSSIQFSSFGENSVIKFYVTKSKTHVKSEITVLLLSNLSGSDSC